MSTVAPEPAVQPDRFKVAENGLHAVFEAPSDGPLRLLHFASRPFNPRDVTEGKEKWFRALELQATGFNQNDHAGLKHTGTSPGDLLRFTGMESEEDALGRHLRIHQEGTGLKATMHWQFFHDLPVIRAWTELENTGDTVFDLEHVSSFCLTGVEKEGVQPLNERQRFHLCHNSWKRELQWQQFKPAELGIGPVPDSGFSSKRVNPGSLGGWCTGDYLAMGALENIEAGFTLAWEIEHIGSWGWEWSTIGFHQYLQLYGPSYNEHHWLRCLRPGERFTSVPVSVTCVPGGLPEASVALDDYRRRIRRDNRDNRELPVIFNDYMNCLLGDPTTEKLIPLIDAAAEAGCEYFVIDAGWYADGKWWDGVGQWLPSQQRFPGGIEEPLERIRQKGMVPGIWLEIESMGIHCPLASEWPDECFFCRRGKRVISHSRYHLDFRHPIVRAHADAVVDRVVREYGAGYIKMDFNINLGAGTEVDADSPGDGFERHNAAYLEWLDAVFERYPDLVIENCGSGGLRMNTALLSRHSVQSTSDCQEYDTYAYIAAASPTIAPPEQQAVWSYPAANSDLEETAFNMVNTLLLRIHQSGHLNTLSQEQLALIHEAIALYKSAIRASIPQARPFWPMGIPRLGDPWLAFGLQTGDRAFLAVYRMDTVEATCDIPLLNLPGGLSSDLLYPQSLPVAFNYDAGAQTLQVTLPRPYTARLFRFEKRA